MHSAIGRPAVRPPAAPARQPYSRFPPGRGVNPLLSAADLPRSRNSKRRSALSSSRQGVVVMGNSDIAAGKATSNQLAPKDRIKDADRPRPSRSRQQQM